MNYVLDTHVLIWRAVEPDKLSLTAANILADGDNRFFIPTVGLLEVQYLHEIGRIEINPAELRHAISANLPGEIIPFDEAALWDAIKLTGNRDPFDRMILGQAMALEMPILTRDRWMKKMAPRLAVF